MNLIRLQHLFTFFLKIILNKIFYNLRIKIGEIVMKKGKAVFDGDIDDAIEKYNKILDKK